MTKHGLRPSLSLLLGLSFCSLLSAPICAVCAEPLLVERDQIGAAPDPFPGETRDLELYSAKRFQLSFEGYTQLRYQQIENDTELTDFVGRNDGFSLSNARLRITGVRERLAFRIELDGARDRREANNRARGEVSAEVLDAWLAFRPHRAFQLHAGRLKPLFDRSEMLLTEELLFIDRPLESRGVFGVEGLNVDGLSLRREVGLRLDGSLPLNGEAHLFSWYLSLTNGNNGRQSLNDNDQLAYTGRLQLDHKLSVKHRMSFGAGLRYNEVSRGALPDLVSERRFAYTFDGAIKAHGVILEGQYMQRSVKALDIDIEPELISAGWHLSLGYQLGKLHKKLRGFVPAYRYATYDPTCLDGGGGACISAVKGSELSGDSTLIAGYERDLLAHHTFGLSWFLNRTYAGQPPLKLQLNYTLTEEHAQRSLSNDRLDIMFQLTF